LRRYFMQTMRAAFSNGAVAKELFSVSHLVKPPAALFAPGVAARVALHALGDALAGLARRGARSPAASS